MDNIGLIVKARKLQERIDKRLSDRKTAKKERYKEFLANPPRELPSIKKLKKFRNIFFYFAFVFIAIPSLQILFFYETTWNSVITALIPVIMGIPFFILAAFGAIVDYSIYKRSSGTEKTVIKW